MAFFDRLQRPSFRLPRGYLVTPDLAEAEALSEFGALAALIQDHLARGPFATHEDEGVAGTADIDRLLHDADLALRRAKALERGTVCAFEPAMSEMARERLVLERDLSAALAAD